jgi:hypothetical protein
MMAPHAVEISITSRPKDLERAASFAGWLLLRHPQWAIQVLLDRDFVTLDGDYLIITVNDPALEAVVTAELVRWKQNGHETLLALLPLDRLP